MYCGFCLKWYTGYHDSKACWKQKHDSVMKKVEEACEVDRLEYYYNLPASEVNR